MWKQFADMACVLCLGVGLGILSKFLDCTPSNSLPSWIEMLDFRNFLGRFPFWILIAVCISIYSKTPIHAALNVFLFFVGMVASYYLYSNYIAGFFPRNYAMIWVGFTILSPFLAYICWHAKRTGKIAVFLSAGIIAVLFNMTFSYGVLYFSVISPLELVVFLIGVFILRRNKKETGIMLGSAILLAFLLNAIVPFQFF